MTLLLADHYGKQAERLRRAAQGYVDDKLREIFPPVGGEALRPADALFRERRDDLSARIVRWSGFDEDEAAALLAKLEDRCTALGLQYRLRRRHAEADGRRGHGGRPGHGLRLHRRAVTD